MANRIGWKAVSYFAFCSMSCLPAFAQQYPEKPVRIVTSDPGGSPDFAARLMAPALASALGQQIIIDNRVNVLVAGDVVAKAAPDGYTVLLFGPPLWVTPLLQKVSFDATRDFVPLTSVDVSPNVLVVTPALPVKSVKDLIDLAKRKPGQLNYGSGSSGSINHLAAEMFNAMAGVKTTRVNYKGAAPALMDLMGGQVQLMFASTGSVTQHIKSGRVRALAVTSARPSTLFPGVPAMATSGVPGFEAVSIIGLFGPIGIPTPVIGRLNSVVRAVLQNADIKEKLLNSGVEALGSSSEELATIVNEDTARWAKVIKAAGIRVE